MRMGQRKTADGRKRHIATDTMGLLLSVVVTAASTQDRDGAHPLLARLRGGLHHRTDLGGCWIRGQAGARGA